MRVTSWSDVSVGVHLCIALTDDSAVRRKNVAQPRHLQGELFVRHQNNRLPQGPVGERRERSERERGEKSATTVEIPSREQAVRKKREREIAKLTTASGANSQTQGEDAGLAA